MAKKGKLWNKLFTKKNNGTEKAEEHGTGFDADSQTDQPESGEAVSYTTLKGMEVTYELCHFCYERFMKGDVGYKCPHCDVLYHFPDCIKNQGNCRSCGEKIILTDNLYRFLKIKSVICPQCGMKVKLFFDTGQKLNITCPNCGHEGNLPNPYLRVLQVPRFDSEEPSVESLEDNIQPETMDKDEDSDMQLWDKNGIYGNETGYIQERELEHELDVTGLEPELPESVEEYTEDGPKIVEPEKRKKRKPKLVALDQTVSCKICTKEITLGSPVLVCRCGKKYHENCATEVLECPTCDCNLLDIQRMYDESEFAAIQEQLSKMSELELGGGLESDQKKTQEPKLELGTELDTTLTFENLEIGDQDKILKAIGQGISKAPGLEFKLVYIFGTNNEAMTHFLQAIGNFILYTESELKVRYTTIDRFLTEYKQSVELTKQDLFEEFYSEADILLLDNFHNISNKKVEKEIFFKIFDRLLNQGKQLVIAGNSAINEIKALDKNSVKSISDRIGLIIHI